MQCGWIRIHRSIWEYWTDPYRLGLKGCDLADFPVEVVDTAEPTILLPVKSLDTLLRARPDEQKILDLTGQFHNNLLYAFSCETLHSSTAQGRMFAPNIGIPEESATGLANGALACYLYRHKVAGTAGLVFEQGYVMNRPSEVLARLEVDGREIRRVSVGGSAIVVGECDITP
ncbi:PhzF family phenazine biosynthesis protein [Candidatus Woesearchaeota archaeon]|nr:PhzF family phenazine biosynthesis protein [Candidatus Woesearchaeota archaeon]